jgi:hypothetical protein
MNTTPQNNPQDMLDAYLDGVLDETQRQEFEARIEQDPALRHEVDKQRRIDAAMKRCCPVPDVDVLLNRAIETASRPVRSHGLLFKIGRIAAMIAAGVLVVLAVQWAVGPGKPKPLGEGTYTVLGLETSYRQVVDEGFTPLWRCETDKEFAETYGYRLGQPLVLGALPAGIEALGLSYIPAISFDTIALLATVDSQRVIVFADHTRAVDNTQTELANPGLHLFQRRVGDLMLYELTPLDTPTVLDLLLIPDDLDAAPPADPR